MTRASPPLSILVIAACPFPAGRGSQLLIERTSQSLLERGHRVELLTSRFGEEGRRDPFPVRRAGLPRGRRPIDSRPSLRRALDDALIAIRALGSRPDVLLGHNVEGGVIAGLAGRWLRRPAVYLRHSLFADERALASDWPRVARAAYGVPERWAETLASRIVVLAPDGQAPPRVARPVDWVPPPVDPHERPIDPADGLTLYYEGNRDAYQNPSWLDAALRASRRRCPGARLGLAPSPRARPARADLALVPRSLRGGFPMKLLAHQVSGIPALCTESGAPGLVDGTDAFILRGPATRDRFAAAACGLLGQPERLRALRETARARALKRSDPARSGELLERSLRRAAHGGGDGPSVYSAAHSTRSPPPPW
ncbi:MAG: glycosyltransferase family 4 protein [Myxococcota bacterium]